MILGYARVSTEEQSVFLQHDALKQAGCERVFTDKASGKDMDRPMLLAVLDHLRPGDKLVIWKLDRLGRNTAQLLELVDQLQAKSIQFESLTDKIDTTTAAGRCFFTIMAALATMERELIRERTLAGLRASRARGRFGGRKPKFTKPQRQTIKRLVEDKRISVTELAERYGVTRGTLYRIAKEESA